MRMCYNLIQEVVKLKKYEIMLTDDLSCIYENIAKMNKMKVEECLSIILERVIRTMINRQESEK